jgi:hypothetical protein
MGDATCNCDTNKSLNQRIILVSLGTFLEEFSFWFRFGRRHFAKWNSTRREPSWTFPFAETQTPWNVSPSSKHTSRTKHDPPVYPGLA